jgi:Tol biopolymer transport system component
MLLTVVCCANTSRELITVNADGTGVRGRKVEKFAADFAVSPDGRRLAYHNGVGIFVSDLNGHHRRRIARVGDMPTWSPDGRLIAYQAGRGHGNVGLQFYVVSPQGGRAHRLPGVVGSQMAWSPDGKKIAFTRGSSRTSQRSELALVGARGGRARVLYRPRYAYGAVGRIDWSPDGRRLVMDVTVERPDCEGCSPQELPPAPTPSEKKYAGIDVIRADGSGIRRLSQDGGAPVWSPDGRRVAFVCSNASPSSLGTVGVCVIDQRGRHRRQIFTTPRELWAPISWLPR